MKEIPTHPFAELLPPMSTDDLAALAEDIARNGQHEPIVIHNGMILDGRHRYAACKKLGITPRTALLDANLDPLEFVLSRNLHRRNLTPSQRAAVAARSLPHFRSLAKQAMSATARQRGAVVAGRATTLAGKRYGVSHEYVARCYRLLDAAPAIFEQVFSGQLTLSQATTRARIRKAPARSGLRVLVTDLATGQSSSIVLERCAATRDSILNDIQRACAGAAN